MSRILYCVDTIQYPEACLSVAKAKRQLQLRQGEIDYKMRGERT